MRFQNLKFALRFLFFCNPFLSSGQSALLYEITGNNLKQPSYLFGTIHLICPDDFIWSDSISSRISKSQQVVLEMDVDAPETMKYIQENVLFTDGKHLSDFISKKDADTLNAWFKSQFNVGLKEIGQMKPLGILSMMSMKLMDCIPESYETRISKLAAEQNKKVIGLESVREQMNYFDQIPVEKQVAQMVEMVMKLDAGKKQFASMVSLYKKQDSEGLLTLVRNSSFEFDAFENVLLDKRNQLWIKSIINLTKSNPSFIAVGAGHLAGNKGLVSLLKKEGFTIKAVRW